MHTQDMALADARALIARAIDKADDIGVRGGVAVGGTVDFIVDGRPTPLSPGQLAVIPGNVPHSATVAAGGVRVVSVNVWRLRAR